MTLRIARVARPKTYRATCKHCQRRRLSRFIEWHPGIDDWQCSDFSDCDAAIAKADARKQQP